MCLGNYRSRNWPTLFTDEPFILKFVGEILNWGRLGHHPARLLLPDCLYRNRPIAMCHRKWPTIIRALTSRSCNPLVLYGAHYDAFELFAHCGIWVITINFGSRAKKQIYNAPLPGSARRLIGAIECLERRSNVAASGTCHGAARVLGAIQKRI